MLDARMEYGVVEEIDEKMIDDKISHLSLVISSLTGIAIPDTDLMFNAFIEQLYAFICKFGYGKYTVSEIILAFQFNAFGNLRMPMGDYLTPVELIGKYINVSYIAKVLDNYKSVRFVLDRKLENFIDSTSDKR